MTQKSITVNVDSGQGKVYGNVDPTLTYTYTPLSFSDTIGGSLAFADTLTGSLARGPGENVGNYAIGKGSLAASSNYNMSFVAPTSGSRLVPSR